MLLTRSIRRTLVSGLGLVVILVVLSTITSIMGVASYQRMVNDLELSITKLPRRADLISSLSLLLPPLSVEIPGPSQASPEARARLAELQAQRFERVFQDVRGRLTRFQQVWQDLPDGLRHGDAELTPYTALFRAVEGGMNEIERGKSRLSDPDARPSQVGAILVSISRVIDVAEQLPDPANRLGERVQQARDDYQLHRRIVAVFGCFSVVILIGLMGLGYQLIFVPIRKLHQGVRRIASGDYGYRLKINTQCEIAQLGNAFNDMVLRIQEDQEHKEREIAERSKQLILSERLAGAGFLASGVAHEINNPLSVIMTAAYGLESRLDDTALSGLNAEDRVEVREYLGLIQSEAERCERITKKLLDFSHGQGEERNLYDVTAIVEEVVSMVKHLSRYQDRHISVNRTTPLRAWVNAPEIKQVLLNLVANALDATSAGGHVQILLRECPEAAEITVQDDGCGMTQEQLRHVFEPFFTTKEVGKGTGLGLAITHRIVVDHGGTLEVESAGPGEGARFRLRLPRKAVRSQAA